MGDSRPPSPRRSGSAPSPMCSRGSPRVSGGAGGAGALFDRPGEAVAYRRGDGQNAVGALRRIPAARWAVVAELPRAEAFGRVGGLRSLTAVMIIAILAGVALMVYILALLILGPLGRLSAAAAKVAAGDLSVELPVGGSGEVGYFKHVFSTVVVRLRERDSQ